jgi:hypothetical protein
MKKSMQLVLVRALSLCGSMQSFILRHDDPVNVSGLFGDTLQQHAFINESKYSVWNQFQTYEGRKGHEIPKAAQIKNGDTLRALLFKGAYDTVWVVPLNKYSPSELADESTIIRIIPIYEGVEVVRKGATEKLFRGNGVYSIKEFESLCAPSLPSAPGGPKMEAPKREERKVEKAEETKALGASALSELAKKDIEIKQLKEANAALQELVESLMDEQQKLQEKISARERGTVKPKLEPAS